MKSFRNEIFDLCKKLKSSNEFNNLRKVLTSLLIYNKSEESQSAYNPKQDIAHNGIKLNCDFNGIILAFEKQLSVFELQETISLSDNEFYQLSFGNYIITNFINSCLEDIKALNSTIGYALNPYSFFVPIKTNDFKFDFDISIINPSVSAFKNSKVYTEIVNSNILQVLKSVPDKEVNTLIKTLDKDIIKIPMDNVPNEILALKMRELESRRTHKIEKMDALSILSFKIIALREMLKNACKLLYSAILGLDLLVFNEDCLIDLEKNVSNIIYRYMTILIQGMPLSPFKDNIGDIILFTIDTDMAKYHEFGMIRSITSNLSAEDGETSKISFCILDEELNPIFSLTQ